MYHHEMIKAPFTINRHGAELLFEITCREVVIYDSEEEGMSIFFGDVLITTECTRYQQFASALSKAMSNKEIEVTFGEDEKLLQTKIVNQLWARRYDGFKQFLDEYDAFEPLTPDSVNGYVYPYGLTRTMYRRTGCGAWAQLSCDSNRLGYSWLKAELTGIDAAPEKVKLTAVHGLRIGTIVEGSDAEFMAYEGDVYWLNPDEVEDGIQRMEGQAIVAWEEANEIRAELAYQEEGVDRLDVSDVLKGLC